MGLTCVLVGMPIGKRKMLFKKKKKNWLVSICLWLFFFFFSWIPKNFYVLQVAANGYMGSNMGIIKSIATLQSNTKS